VLHDALTKEQNVIKQAITRTGCSIGRNVIRTVVIFTSVAAVLSGCATSASPTPATCTDLTGTYENQSSPPGQSLAPFFFGADDRAPQVDISSQNGSGIVVSTPNRKTILTVDRDFVCSAEGIRLTKTDARNIRLPPLIVENEIFHYVFGKASDGSLRMTTHVETKGTSFGIPIGTRQEQQSSEIRWRAVPSR
jgi:hypothetical protein